MPSVRNVYINPLYRIDERDKKMEELWKSIKINNEITKYEISNYGRCRNIKKLHWKTKGILAVKINKKSGYCQYCIVHKNKNYYKYVHRLVAEAFVKGDTSLHVNHIDGNKQNNCYSNLEWVTMKENMRHCFDTGLSTVNKPILQYSLDGKFIKEYPSASEAERQLNVSARSISSALTATYFQSNGYQWKFKYDDRKIEDISNNVKLSNICVVQLSLNGNFIREFNKIADAYKLLNKTNNGIISQVCKGNRQSYLGYKWMYSSDYYK